MAVGKCPSCGKVINEVRFETVSIKNSNTSWNGITYYCPSCLNALSCAIDPVALKSDTVNAVLHGAKEILKDQE